MYSTFRCTGILGSGLITWILQRYLEAEVDEGFGPGAETLQWVGLALVAVEAAEARDVVAWWSDIRHPLHPEAILSDNVPEALVVAVHRGAALGVVVQVPAVPVLLARSAFHFAILCDQLLAGPTF